MSNTDHQLFINPQAEALSMDNIKSFEGFENISDEEAEMTISGIHILCDIIYHHLTSERNLTSEKEEFNNDNNNPQKLAA